MQTPNHQRKGRWMLSWMRRIRKASVMKLERRYGKRSFSMNHILGTQLFLTRNAIQKPFPQGTIDNFGNSGEFEKTVPLGSCTRYSEN